MKIMRSDNAKRKCETKEAYATRDAAFDSMVNSMSKKRGLGLPIGKYLRIYKCNICNNYHITKQRYKDE